MNIEKMETQVLLFLYICIYILDFKRIMKDNETINVSLVYLYRGGP